MGLPFSKLFISGKSKGNKRFVLTIVPTPFSYHRPHDLWYGMETGL